MQFGCRCTDWDQVLVSDPFRPEAFEDCRFSGRVYLDTGGQYPLAADLPAAAVSLPEISISNSRIGNSYIAAGSTITDASLCGVFLEPGVRILSSNIHGGSPGESGAQPFGIGMSMALLNESLPVQLPLMPDWTLPDYLERLHRSRQSPDMRRTSAAQTPPTAIPPVLHGISILGRGCSVMHTRQIRNSYLGPGCSCTGADEVRDTTLLNGGAGPSRVGTGCILRMAALQPGAQADTQARIERSCILETASIENSALVSDSIIGPGSAIGQGEVTASVLGPLTGLHHQSLLIAADWSAGRGNVGYGANVGSNHSSRMADREIRIGEGMFFGLDTAVQFPANYQDAPYSIVATAVVLPPQRMAMPFSLIVPLPDFLPGGSHRSDKNLQIPAGANRLVPGWVLDRNLFAIFRNWQKYQDRFTARAHHIDPFPLRQEIRQQLQRALTILQQVAPAAESPDGSKGFLLPLQIPEVGHNIVLQQDLLAAIQAYRNAIRFGELWDRSEQAPAGLSTDDRSGFARLLQQYLDGITAAWHKDLNRHAAIFPEDDWQTDPENDPVLQAVLAPLQRKLDSL